MASCTRPLDDGGDARSLDDPASFNGKILRLNANGTTPDDAPRKSPVFSVGPASPRGIAWHQASGHLWTADKSSVGKWNWTSPPESIAAVRDELFVGSDTGLVRAQMDRGDPSRLTGLRDLAPHLTIGRWPRRPTASSMSRPKPRSVAFSSPRNGRRGAPAIDGLGRSRTRNRIRQVKASLIVVAALCCTTCARPADRPLVPASTTMVTAWHVPSDPTADRRWATHRSPRQIRLGYQIFTDTPQRSAARSPAARCRAPTAT